MVFFITTILLIGYGLNAVIAVATILSADSANKRGQGLLFLGFTLLAGAGVIYLAAH
jgi:hypothetical protein